MLFEASNRAPEMGQASLMSIYWHAQSCLQRPACILQSHEAVEVLLCRGSGKPRAKKNSGPQDFGCEACDAQAVCG